MSGRSRSSTDDLHRWIQSSVDQVSRHGFAERHLDEFTWSPPLALQWSAGIADALTRARDLELHPGLTVVVHVDLPTGQGLTIGWAEWEVQEAYACGGPDHTGGRPPSLYVVDSPHRVDGQGAVELYRRRQTHDGLTLIYESVVTADGDGSRGLWVQLDEPSRATPR